jgi:hypothetical protein
VKYIVSKPPPDLERPIGFNLLDLHQDQRPVVADGVVSAFRHVWPDSWGPRLEHFLLNSVRALLDAPGQTLLGIGGRENVDLLPGYTPAH